LWITWAALWISTSFQPRLGDADFVISATRNFVISATLIRRAQVQAIDF
jgi:hypothetical protein